MDSIIWMERTRVRDLGIKITPNILEALLLSVIAGRHLSVVTNNVQATEESIESLFVDGWGFAKGDEFVIVTLNFKSIFDPTTIFGLPELASGDTMKLEPRILILEGLENTSKNFQRDLDDYINDVARLSNNDNIFMLIILGKTTLNSSIDEVLLDDIWIEQTHECRIELHEVESDNLTDRNLQSAQFIDLVMKARKDSQRVVLVREIKTYIYDIVIFVRTNRFVVGGLPTFVLGEFKQFVAIYAVLHGYEYVVPEMVRQAAYSLLPIRIHMLKDPQKEPSIQYGSDPALVSQILDKVDIPIIIDEVMGKIQPPI